MTLDSSLTGQEGLNSWQRLSMESCREGTGKIRGSDLYSLFCRGEIPDRELVQNGTTDEISRKGKIKPHHSASQLTLQAVHNKAGRPRILSQW